MLKNKDNLYAKLALSCKPVPYMTVVDSANKHRYIESGADRGRYSTKRTPYIEEPMNKLSMRCQTKEVVLLFGHQTGKTECLLSHIDYVTRYGIGHSMLILPTDKLAKTISKSRLSPILDRFKDIDEKSIKRRKSREDTLFVKKYPGGYLIITGSESAANVKSMPIRFLWIDELSECSQFIAQSGDFEMLAEARTATYSLRKKIVKSSTPKIEGECRIERNYNESTMKKYHVPCPECNNKQLITFEKMIWKSVGSEHYPKSTQMKCEYCGVLIKEHNKTWMLENGVWRAEHPGRDKEGYHLNTLYSPYGWTSWSEVVEEFLKSKNDEEQLRAFINSYLAKTFPKTYGEILDIGRLFAQNREKYEHEVPKGVYVITAGVDIQGDRAEIEVIGWGLNEESWSIDYIVHRGDPMTAKFWDGLDDHLLKKYKNWKGMQVGIDGVCVDSGFASRMVYKFVKPRLGRHIFAIKGASTYKQFVSRPSRNNAEKVPVFNLGTQQGKDIIFARLNIKHDPEKAVNDGYCHFPASYDESYFEGLTAEKKVKKYVKGYVQEDYVKCKPFNEPLDCRLYGYAAYIILNPNINKIKTDIDSFELEKPVKKRARPGSRWVSGSYSSKWL